MYKQRVPLLTSLVLPNIFLQVVAWNTAAKSMRLSCFCDWKAVCNLLENRASTSAVLMDPDRRADV